MPCDSIIQNSITWSQEHTDLDLFAKAMKNLGYNALSPTRFRNTQGDEVELNLKGGTLLTSSRYRTINTDEIKQGYSVEVVRTAAKSYGWKLEEKGKNEFEVVKNS